MRERERERENGGAEGVRRSDVAAIACDHNILQVMMNVFEIRGLDFMLISYFSDFC